MLCAKWGDECPLSQEQGQIPHKKQYIYLNLHMNGVEHPFFPGAMIVAPPNVTHQITNTGTELLRVLCVFSPPWTGEDLKNRAMKTIEEAKKRNS